METTLNDKGANTHLDGGRTQDNGNLLADIHELLERVKHVADPEVSRLRARVEQGVSSARMALVDRSEQIQRQARDAMKAGDTYVRDRPWQSVGVAALAGIFVGFLVGRR